MVLTMPRLTQPDEQFAARPFETARLPGPERVSRFRLCPSCGKHMRALSESEIYECKACRVFATDAG
jgi:predicted RNA-binding Zn-ribbon protein involved in translation (DUF1610 family)